VRTGRRGQCYVGLVFACLSALLVGCAAANHPAVQSSAGLGVPSSAIPVASTVPPAHAAGIVAMADLVERGFAVLALAPNPNGTGRARLSATSDFGRTFTDIGPRVPTGWQPDSVSFLDRHHGWFATSNPANNAEVLYRTVDGGHSWRSSSAPGHNLAAGSGDTMQFLTPTDGWLVDIVANAPSETLYRTRDAGASWHPVTGLPSGPLPQLGLVRFQPASTVGWLGGTPFSRALYRSDDQGRTWQRAVLQAPQDTIFDLPSIFGTTVLEPVTVQSASSCALRVLRSIDAGNQWSLMSQLPTIGCRSSVSTSFPTATAGWATGVRAGQPTVYRTTDSGQRWTQTTAPPGQSALPPSIHAVDAERAWLLATGPGENGYRIYSTDDAGLNWQRIDQRAVEAPH
jgi:photosystem II stability/assembly factor-like uncharacterized protein